jgi:hypothetical protein
LAIFSVGLFFLIYPVRLLGGLNYYALTPEGASYRPWFPVHPVHYFPQGISFHITR